MDVRLLDRDRRVREQLTAASLLKNGNHVSTLRCAVCCTYIFSGEFVSNFVRLAVSMPATRFSAPACEQEPLIPAAHEQRTDGQGFLRSCS